MPRRSNRDETNLWIIAAFVGCLMFVMVFVVADFAYPNRCWTCFGRGVVEHPAANRLSERAQPHELFHKCPDCKGTGKR